MALDQFELYSRTANSGAFDGFVYYGNVFTTGQYDSRRGLFDKTITKHLIESVATTMSGVDYHDILLRSSGSGYKDLNFMFQKGFNQDEIYYDSILPHPYEYARIVAVSGTNSTSIGYEGSVSFIDDNHTIPCFDGLTIFEPLQPTASLGSGPNLKGINVMVPNSFTRNGSTLILNSIKQQKRLILSPSTTNARNETKYTNTGARVGNFTWLSCFPFQNVYKNLKRLSYPTNIIKPKNLIAGGLPGLYRVPQPFLFSWDTTLNELKLGPSTGLASIWLSLEQYQTSLMFILTSSAVFPQSKSGSLAIYQQKTLNNDYFDLPDGNYLNRWWFGFGDGPNGMCLPLRTVKHLSVFTASFIDTIGEAHNSGVFYGIGVQQRGWKYGVYNGSPSSTQIIFRRNKFGQFRDMLEQRPFTKFFNGKPQQSSVKITFSPTSQDYLTASNSDLNLQEVGAYDFESRCGKPFFDL